MKVIYYYHLKAFIKSHYTGDRIYNSEQIIRFANVQYAKIAALSQRFCQTACIIAADVV